LRRGLAYERTDRVALAREDFNFVKSLDNTNKQALEALYRLRPSEEEVK
jgi:hypothetical protein